MSELDDLLAEQSAYYSTLGPDYGSGVPELPGLVELERAVTDLSPAGDVLELACGPGTWTGRLLERAATVTAVDGSAEMLALAHTRLGEEHPDRADRARFVRADLFGWQPDRTFDAVFFGFWLSHVPLERLPAFWATVDRALAPGGRVLFVDDAYRTSDEMVPGSAPGTVHRRVPDGRRFRLVKVPHTPDELRERLAALGWDVSVRSLSGPFYWGTGTRAATAPGR